jgi:TonB family protein
MNLAFRGGSPLLSFCATSVCLLASLLAQEKTGEESDVHSSVQTGATSPSDFEVKIDDGQFWVRRKGTQEWRKSLQISEPIAVGSLDSDRKVYVATKAIKPPKAIHTEQPDFPDAERKSRKEGRVSVHIIVDEHGKVLNPIVDAGLGPAFDKAAIEAVKKWTFQPAKLDGQPVAVLVEVTTQFKLSAF